MSCQVQSAIEEGCSWRTRHNDDTLPHPLCLYDHPLVSDEYICTPLSSSSVRKSSLRRGTTKNTLKCDDTAGSKPKRITGALSEPNLNIGFMSGRSIQFPVAGLQTK